jgi:hypothetical protein
MLANCISRCIFEETDWESDELILMKLLELSALCLQCDASKLLTISAAWDIYSTCMSIHSHYRASKILKSEAETVRVPLLPFNSHYHSHSHFCSLSLSHSFFLSFSPSLSIVLFLSHLHSINLSPSPFLILTQPINLSPHDISFSLHFSLPGTRPSDLDCLQSGQPDRAFS